MDWTALRRDHYWLVQINQHWDVYKTELEECSWDLVRNGRLTRLLDNNLAEAVQLDHNPFRLDSDQGTLLVHWQHDEYGNYHLLLEDITNLLSGEAMESQFVSLASHQLRTPLTAIRWLTERMKKPTTGELNEKQSMLVQQMQDNTVKLIQLVNDLLNITRMEAGKIAVQPEEVDIKLLVREVIGTYERLIVEKKLRWEIQVPEVRPVVHVDPRISKQIFDNLISNAIKYTPESGQLVVRIEDIGDNLRVSVKDSGIGIPEEEQPQIFRRFFRASNAASSEINGTGLGMYLVRLLCEAVGGSIWFESQRNNGTVFVVELPKHDARSQVGDTTLVE